MTRLDVRRESWPIRGSFAISRGSRTATEVVVVTLTRDGHTGRGECVPYPRYGETVEGVIADIESLRARLAAGLDREVLQTALPAGAARNAVDCAFWDLEAKRAGKRVFELAGLAAPKPLITAYTLSLDAPDAMGRAAAENAHRPLLKLKVTGEGDLERVRAVRTNAPNSQLVVDANEAWTPEQFTRFVPELAGLGVAMIEQPLPATADAPLASLKRSIPVCADESCHDTATLEGLVGRYDMINIKLDKTGGLTEALKLRHAAKGKGLGIMVGCMIATSLSMAPAILVAQGAEVVDLDGPLLLARDRDAGLRYEGSTVYPAEAVLWG
ncbi:MAG: N-acetyl-D-Glu racemase DgcA [Rhodospirillaceae bacterium]